MGLVAEPLGDLHDSLEQPPEQSRRQTAIRPGNSVEKSFRYALQTTGALLVLAALAVFFVLPLSGGILAAPLLIAGLLLVWLQS